MLFDDPPPSEILAAAADWLRRTAIPQLAGATAFEARVLANALDLVRRQIAATDLPPAIVVDDLGTALGCSGDDERLADRIAAQLRAGSMALDTPGLSAWLWSVTEAKLSVDQPGYPGLKRAQQLRAKLDKQ